MADNLTYDTLKKALDSLPPRKEQVFFIHIDDLLPMLRSLRKQGYHTERRRRSDGVKLSIWLVWLDDYLPSAPIEFYVDVTRTMERGKIYGVDMAAIRPKWHLELSLRWRSPISTIAAAWRDDKYTRPLP